ncbi:hypothetical protein AMTRI_Chr09g41870 [Amborella trichopoda]
MKVSVERDASMDISYDSSEERVKSISVDRLNSKETKASLSGVEPEFKFAIASSSNEENDSKPFVDCSISEEKVPQYESMDVYQEVAIRSEMALLLSRIARSLFISLLISGDRKASSTSQEDKTKFLRDHHGTLSTVLKKKKNSISKKKKKK